MDGTYVRILPFGWDIRMYAKRSSSVLYACQWNAVLITTVRCCRWPTYTQCNARYTQKIRLFWNWEDTFMLRFSAPLLNHCVWVIDILYWKNVNLEDRDRIWKRRLYLRRWSFGSRKWTKVAQDCFQCMFSLLVCCNCTMVPSKALVRLTVWTEVPLIKMRSSKFA